MTTASSDFLRWVEKLPIAANAAAKEAGEALQKLKESCDQIEYTPMNNEALTEEQRVLALEEARIGISMAQHELRRKQINLRMLELEFCQDGQVYDSGAD